MIATLNLPAALARCLTASAPEAMRLAVARGMVPLPPAQRLASLAVLMADASSEVRSEAREAWQSLPPAFVEDAAGDPELPEQVLDLVAALHPKAHSLLCRVLENPNVGPRTLRRFADSADEAILSRVARNQRVLDRAPELAHKLLDNPSLHPADRGLLSSRYAAPEPELAPPAAGGEPQMAEPAPPEPEEEPPADLPPELLAEGAEADHQNLYQLVQSMSVADKIKLATLGGKSARRLLIRDTNKLVGTAVMKSPKIGEDEVQAVAQDRTVSEEIIRLILLRKDWLKNYPIRLALCQNPKTPSPRALRLLETLQDKDLRQIAKSRNVPSPISAGAVRILARRGKT